MTMMKNDGGRAAAGYQGTTGDCVVRAIAIAAELPYETVYSELAGRMKREHLKRKRGSPRDGVARTTYEPYLKELGFEWVPTMKIGQGCRVHLKAEELPKGRIVATVSKHLVAVVDGVIHDTYDPSRGGTRCVYGYYVKAAARKFSPEQIAEKKLAIEAQTALNEVRKTIVFGAQKSGLIGSAAFDAVLEDVRAAEAKIKTIIYAEAR